MLYQGEDGKKLKSRSGDTVRLKDLLDEAIKQAEDDMLARKINNLAEGTIPTSSDIILTDEELNTAKRIGIIIIMLTL